MATLAWVVFKHHKKADGTYNPKIKVYHNGTTVYLSTQIYTSLVRFKKGESIGSITDGNITDALNSRIKEIRKILNMYDDVIDNCDDAKAVAAFIDKKMNTDKNLDFIAFAKSYADGLKDNGSQNIAKSLIVNLCLFINADSIPVKKITSSFLLRFESWMKSERIIKVGNTERRRKALANSSVQTYMEKLQTIYNRMLLQYNDYEIGDIVIPGDPFKAYKTSQDVTYKQKATEVEIIRKIAGYKPCAKGHSSRTVARDMFMLSFCLAGINLIDIFTCDTYINGRVEYFRTKTKGKKKDKAFTSVPVYLEIHDVFEKYRDTTGKRVFNLYTLFSDIRSLRSSVSYGMKSLCKDLGIEPITFYAARHSFATIARNKCNVDMADVALCLTHTSGFNMTDKYVKPDFTKVDRAVRKVLDYVFKEEQE